MVSRKIMCNGMLVNPCEKFAEQPDALLSEGLTNHVVGCRPWLGKCKAAYTSGADARASFHVVEVGALDVLF